MSKYSDSDLRRMARLALQARDNGDARFFLLVMQLTVRTGLMAADIERRIERLAA